MFALDADRTGFVNAIGRLVDSGLVSKRPDRDDSRAVDVRLTAKGRLQLRRLTPRVRRVNDVLFAGMTAEEMAHVHRFLRRVITQSTPAVERLTEK